MSDHVCLAGLDQYDQSLLDCLDHGGDGRGIGIAGHLHRDAQGGIVRRGG